jgi:glycosyltransferase involved in cell wall biosynthesis
MNATSTQSQSMDIDSVGTGSVGGHPLVSVLIPTYNRAQFLPEAIDSILAQSYPNIEIVVVDDGSTDGTPEVMARYAGKVIYQRQKNGGVASARNTTLRIAHGEFIAFLDSDDIAMPDRISMQMACMKQVPDAVLCSSDFTAFTGDREIETSHIANYYSNVGTTPGGVSALYSSRQTLTTDGHPWIVAGSNQPITILIGSAYENLAWGNFIHPPTILVRRQAIEAAGEFDAKIPIATEYEWLIRVSRLGRFAYLDTPLIRYRYSEDQLSDAKHTGQIAMDAIKAMEIMRRKDPELYRQHKGRFRQRIGNCYLSAANAVLEDNKWVAWGHFVRSLAHGVFKPACLRVLGKLLLPRSVIDLRRRRWQPDNNRG